MKTSKAVIVITIVVLIGIFVFVWSGRKDQAANTLPTTDQASSIKGCYVATLGKDVYTLTILSQNADAVTGFLSFKNFEKDSSSGTFVGTYQDGILLGDYSFDSEGMHSVLQVIFKNTADGFVRGYGNMNSTGDHFADLNNITYDTSALFKATPNC